NVIASREAGWSGRSAKWSQGKESASSLARPRVDPRSCVFLVALQKLDRDALRTADEADAYAGPYRGRLPRELDALGLDLGRDLVDVLHRQSEMIEPLIGRDGRGVDAVAGRDRRDEHVGAAELDVDPSRTADDDAAENVLEPGR